MKPRRIGDILSESLERMQIRGALREKMALFEWETAVGAEIARASRPVLVRDGVMTVETASPAWAQQLSLLKPRLLKAINARLGERLIKDLRFRSGQGFEMSRSADKGGEMTPPPDGAAVRGTPGHAPGPGREPDALSKEGDGSSARAEEWASAIGDEQLRARWRRLMHKAKAGEGPDRDPGR